MAISNLETIIDNIEQMIETVRPDSRGRIMLPRDTLRQLVGELKSSVPKEIKEYQAKSRELEQSKQKELEAARHNAERIVSEAEAMRSRLLDDNEQVKIAEQKAKELVDNAQMKANELMIGSDKYVREIQEKSLKDYDDSLVYMANYMTSIGNEMSNLLNSQITVIQNKLQEIMNARTELQNRINQRNAMNVNGNY